MDNLSKMIAKQLVELAYQAESCLSKGMYKTQDMGELVILKEMINHVKSTYVRKQDADREEN